jgi:hypothetical protein
VLGKLETRWLDAEICRAVGWFSLLNVLIKPQKDLPPNWITGLKEDDIKEFVQFFKRQEGDPEYFFSSYGIPKASQSSALTDTINEKWLEHATDLLLSPKKPGYKKAEYPVLSVTEFLPAMKRRQLFHNALGIPFNSMQWGSHIQGFELKDPKTSQELVEEITKDLALSGATADFKPMKGALAQHTWSMSAKGSKNRFSWEGPQKASLQCVVTKSGNLLVYGQLADVYMMGGTYSAEQKRYARLLTEDPIQIKTNETLRDQSGNKRVDLDIL